MLFSSIHFLFAFLPCVLLFYYFVRFSVPLKNLVLLLASLYFYRWGEPSFVYVMLASIAGNYLCGLWIGAAGKKGSKAASAALFAGIALNLGLLFVFKYLTFVLTNLHDLLSLSFAVPQIVLPIGISFFTFQSMSYLIDVYRGDAEVQKNPLDLALYVALFPQLIAGPIVRYQTVAEQIRSRRETISGFSFGVRRFLVGLFKKVLISNQMALAADRAFSMNADGTLGPAMAWLGALSYAFQIYYDFAGYSDMAIGLGQMFGFQFEENFNYPYISTSVTEFWRRWHISLGTWFRDYVYIPLGGSRVKSRGRLVCNLAVVWILTGIWHGASWNFLCWGIWFFILLTAEKLLFAEAVRPCPFSWKRIPGWLYAMTAVLFGWVLFRAETLPLAGQYFGTMFGFHTPQTPDTTALLYLGQKWMYFAAAVLFSVPLVPYLQNRLDALRRRGGAVSVFAVVCDGLSAAGLLVLFLVTCSFLLKGTYNPFIYFNF